MPYLYIIAGPNGSGKSTNAENLLPEDIKCFDFDKEFTRQYKSFEFDFENRYECSHNQAYEVFTKLMDESLDKNKSFAFETNFQSETIMDIARKFKEKGYELNLIFIDVNSVELSKDRVMKRKSEGGHNVPESQIEQRYKESAVNANKFHKEFDHFVLIDNSKGVMNPLLEIKQDKLVFKNNIIDPIHNTRFNDIFKGINKDISKGLKF